MKVILILLDDNCMSEEIHSIIVLFQIMYLYYLLGFKLLGAGDTDDDTISESSQSKPPEIVRNRKKNKGHKTRKTLPLRNLLLHVPPEQYEAVRIYFFMMYM